MDKLNDQIKEHVKNIDCDKESFLCVRTYEDKLTCSIAGNQATLLSSVIEAMRADDSLAKIIQMAALRFAIKHVVDRIDEQEKAKNN